MMKADGTKYVFGDQVPVSCCSEGKPSETNFRDRSTQSAGYCAALPKNDKFIGPFTGDHAETWTQFRGLAMCYGGTRAVYGEVCGHFGSVGFVGNCNKCASIVDTDLSNGHKCFKGNDALAAWNDPREWFVHLKSCGCKKDKGRPEAAC